ncbi:MAG: universal stress protein [Thermoleophilia bacterium]
MPAPYAHIACCVDDSEMTDRVIEEAVKLRGLSPGKLSLVSAAPQPLAMTGVPGEWIPDSADLSEIAGRWLRDRAAALKDAEPVLLEGYAPVAVCDWAAEAGCDLLVAGAHRGTVQRLMLGGFAAYLAYHAPCAVLLVRPPGEHKAAGDHKPTG